MVIYDVKLSECERIADELGIRFSGHLKYETREGKPRVQGMLLPKPKPAENPYQKTSASFYHQGRKVHGICWHGYRDFMRALFDYNPDARIVSSRMGKIEYNGADHFEETYQETGFINVGPPICPVNACEACSCKEAGYAY